MGASRSSFTSKSCRSYTVDVFVSGDYSAIKLEVSKFVLRGLCVSVSPVDYLYTMGIEAGARVTLLNYPRYEVNPDEVLSLAVLLGERVTRCTCQGSYLVVAPEETFFYSRRASDL